MRIQATLATLFENARQPYVQPDCNQMVVVDFGKGVHSDDVIGAYDLQRVYVSTGSTAAKCGHTETLYQANHDGANLMQ